MHKRYTIIFTVITFLGVSLLPVLGQVDFFYDVGRPDVNTPATIDLAGETVTATTEPNSIFVQIMKLFGVYTFTNNGNDSQSAINYIQYIVNMGLGLAAFIALIILLYGFYLMFFSKQEEGFDKARKIIIGVTVALLIMGLSWVIIRFLFFLYTLIQ